MAGFLRSLFWWNNMNSSKHPYCPTNMSGPINLYRRTSLNNTYSLNGWYDVNSSEQAVWWEEHEQPERSG